MENSTSRERENREQEEQRAGAMVVLLVSKVTLSPKWVSKLLVLAFNCVFPGWYRVNWGLITMMEIIAHLSKLRVHGSTKTCYNRVERNRLNKQHLGATVLIRTRLS